MNPILQVKLRFASENNKQRPMNRNLRAASEASAEKIEELIVSLKAVLRYYHASPRLIKGLLVDVQYNDIIAKSNRIQTLLAPRGKKPNDVVVGARFSDAPAGKENHIITYYVDQETVEKTIADLEYTRKFLVERLNGKATKKNFNEPGSNISYGAYEPDKRKLRNLVVDCSVIDAFSVPHISEVPDRESFLITFFKTELRTEELLEKIGIDDHTYLYYFYGEDTISVSPALLEEICSKAPYMISMISSDLSQVKPEELRAEPVIEEIEIPDPVNEPTIGVIDTLFDERVYFSKWVENVDYLDEIERMMSSGHRGEHGTEVTSLIVDGPRLNPWLDDGCGRFRVRHFGVCAERISTARLVAKIKKIVNSNPDIHVWNLSLGEEEEVSKNFISYDAAALDALQSSRNVIFVVSGTNDNRLVHEKRLKVGSPADSLNSIVVNSVRRDGQPASYSRRGNVLSFFNKPDVSYYGGDYNERLIAWSSMGGETEVYGSSFAAPWISRKLCYLIDVMGMPREIAKALLIDAAAGWDYKSSTWRQADVMGYGIVPIDIQRVLSSESEEIRFFLYGTSKSYKTTNYAIPIPKDENDKYPYIARATICYYPECSRAQGVDYTNRELSLKFGRVKSDGAIDDINDNTQEDSGVYTDERQSRKEFRKWENTKFISKIMRANRPVKSYGDRLWGVTVTSKERLTTKTGKGLNFGIVITLKEINGVNRIQDFIRACTLRGWIVNEWDVQNRVEIYNRTREEIVFE